MTVSPELERIAQRAALPISVSFRPSWLTGHGIKFVLRTQQGYVLRRTPQNATRAYFALVDSLSKSADRLPSAGTAADCSASCLTPEGVR